MNRNIVDDLFNDILRGVGVRDLNDDFVRVFFFDFSSEVLKFETYSSFLGVLFKKSRGEINELWNDETLNLNPNESKSNHHHFFNLRSGQKSTFFAKTYDYTPEHIFAPPILWEGALKTSEDTRPNAR